MVNDQFISMICQKKAWPFVPGLGSINYQRVFSIAALNMDNTLTFYDILISHEFSLLDQIAGGWIVGIGGRCSWWSA